MSASPAAAEAAKLGPALATVLVAGNMIGSGIYLLPATLATVGSVSLLGWLAATVGALLMAGVFSGLAILRPDIDGLGDYARVGLGRYIGFQSGIAYWVSDWTGVIAVAVAVTGYLTVFLPSLRQPLAAAACTGGVIGLVTLANIAGPRFVGKLGAVTLAFGLLPVVAVALFGWLWFDPHLFLNAWNVSGKSPLQAVQTSLILVFWSFTGMESAIVIAAVVRRPERNVPIATIGGVALSAVVYILASTAIGGVVSQPELARSTAPFAVAVLRMAGPLAAAAVAVCALLKSLGTVSGVTLVTAETTRASAAIGDFPRFLARTRSDGAPVTALLFLGVLEILTVALTISPTIGRQFGVLIDVSTLLTLVTYAWCALALVRFAGAIRSPRWRLAVRACALLGFAFCLWTVAVSDRRLLIVSLVFLAATLPAWGMTRLTGQALVRRA